MKLTVALPTWKNKDIIWLAMEGLCNQINSPEWQLIIHECENDCGIDYFKQWAEQLAKANCKEVIYLQSKERLPLSLKWYEMAKIAKGEHFLLQGSDDYSHPDRHKVTAEANADWYDCQYYYQYHIKRKKLIQYNGFNKGKAHKTGFCMSIRTSLLKKLKPDVLYKNIDGWLFRSIEPNKIYKDTNIYKGVATTGANTISVLRDDYFVNTIYPFQKTNETINTIGVPKYIIDKL